MKKCKKELFVLILQILLFYLLPLFTGPTDVMGMVVVLILSTFVLSVMIGSISDKRAIWLYPIVTVLCFIPSVYVFRNISSLFQGSWYFVVSVAGVGVGVGIKWIRNGLVHK